MYRHFIKQTDLYAKCIFLLVGQQGGIEIMNKIIELNTEAANLAYEMGLNVSKTCEIALKEAIRR